MRFDNDRERLQAVWVLVKELQDDDTHHPHNEAFRAAVLRIRGICQPVFEPTAEDKVTQLQSENEQLKARLAGLEAKVERMSRESKKEP